jgi:hypothetical protein
VTHKPKRYALSINVMAATKLAFEAMQVDSDDEGSKSKSKSKGKGKKATDDSGDSDDGKKATPDDSGDSGDEIKVPKKKAVATKKSKSKSHWIVSFKLPMAPLNRFA